MPTSTSNHYCFLVSSIGWRGDYSPDLSQKEEIPQRRTSGSKSPPPPLPPRNSGGAGTSTPFTFNRDYEQHTPVIKSSQHVLDRRKTSSRLYEIVTEQRTVDLELLDFYYMVKELRQRYPYDDEVNNIGHIIASEFNYHYPLETSIKILVHPSLTALFPDVVSASANKGQFKGYGSPIVFTCDSKFFILSVLIFSILILYSINFS